MRSHAPPKLKVEPYYGFEAKRLLLPSISAVTHSRYWIAQKTCTRSSATIRGTSELHVVVPQVTLPPSCFGVWVKKWVEVDSDCYMRLLSIVRSWDA